jgi:type I restriction enzyme M protein
LLSPYDLGHKPNGKIETAVGRDLLFIERNIDFLRPGGRMAIVLPQGRFNNGNDKRVRDFIAERCRILAVVGLDPNTFKPHTGTRTSVLFVQKWNDDVNLGPFCPKSDDYNIFFATQKRPSKDNSGDKIYVTERLYRVFDLTEGGEPKIEEFSAQEFIARFHSVEKACIYHVTGTDGSHSVLNLTAIIEKYGSLEALKKNKGFSIQRLREAQPLDRLVRDDHGHYIVQHDLFNHEGLTGDGIAEAFREFSIKENLGFF